MAYKDLVKKRLNNLVWYHNNKNKVRLWKNNLRKRQQEYIRNLKTTPCMDCKKYHPYYVMEFDHVKDKKVYSIGNMGTRRYGWLALINEIEKCEIVCSNCHRIRTHMRNLND